MNFDGHYASFATDWERSLTKKNPKGGTGYLMNQNKRRKNRKKRK